MDGQQKEPSKRSTKTPRQSPSLVDKTSDIRCVHCNKGSEHDNFVLCDKCDSWYHFSCVGVDDTVMIREWQCQKCEMAENQSKEKMQSANTLPPNQEPFLQMFESENESSSKKGDSPVIDNQLHSLNQTIIPPLRLSEEVLLATVTKARSSINKQVQQDSSTINQTTAQQTQTTVQQNRKSYGQLSKKSRSVSSKASGKIDLKLQMFEEERELKVKRDQEYLRQKYSFLQDELAAESEDDDVQRSELVNNWVMDQNNPSNYPHQLSSTTNTVTGYQSTGIAISQPNQQLCSSNMNFHTINQVPIQAIGGHGPASHDLGMSTIFPVQDNNDQVFSQLTLGFNNHLSAGPKIHVTSSANVSNVTSSSSNAQVMRSEASNPIGSMTGAITIPIMSTNVSGGAPQLNPQAALNPMAMPYIDGGSIPFSQSQINTISSSGLTREIVQPSIRASTSFGTVFNPSSQMNTTSQPYFSSQMNTTSQPYFGSQMNTTFQPYFGSQMNTTSQPYFGSQMNTTFQPYFGSQMNTTSQPYFGGNQYTSVPVNGISFPVVNNTTVPVVNNTTVPVVPMANSSIPFNNAPVTNANNSGFFNATFQPQMSYVPSASIANGMNQVVPHGNNFVNLGMPGGFGYQNIATRLAFKNEDLKFSGKREDWPLFESEFIAQSQLCGYTDVENLSRLRRMLKGNALTSVRSMLQGSMNLPVVFSTLRMLYGKPEAVINEVYKKARETEHIRSGKLDLLIEFALTVLNLCGTMVTNGLTHHLNNPTLLLELVSKLPDNLKMEWGAIKRYNPNVNLSDFGNWIFDKAQNASEVTILELKPDAGSDKRGENKHNHKFSNHKPKKDDEPGFLNSHVTTNDIRKGNKNQKSEQKSDKPTSSNGPCIACQSTQCKVIANCSKFKSLSQNQRWEKLVENKLCRRCFGQHHHFRCKIQKKCGINGCEQLHHSLLHKDVVEEKPNAAGDNSSTVAQQSRLNTHQIHGENTFLPIIPVTLSHHGRSVKTYAFFDEGSTITLVESRYSRELELSGIKRSLCLRWTNGIVRSEKGSMIVSLNVSGVKREHSSYQLPVVRTVENLELPEQSINLDYLTKRYPHLNDIPVDGFNKVKIGILIGGNYAKLTLPTDVREGDLDEPVARKTRLGWVISGPHDGKSAHGNFVYHHVHECSCQVEHDMELDKLITDFFSLENFGVQVSSRSIESKEDIRARQMLESTTKFLGSRYEVGLLWKYDKVNLPNNFDMALKRLECVERKMASNPKLLENFNKQVQEFLEKGYARKLRKSELPLPVGRTWYLPLFPHINPKKPEKIRPVWDAAAKYKGVSLNNSLLSGPDLYIPLPDVLLRFRERKIPVCGDIREMYHQVRIKKEDQYSQLFLWRNGDSKALLETYVMEVMTFGSTCSPSCAQYVKNLNANKFIDEYPRAVESIVKNHYVDDLMDSVHTEEEAIKLLEEVKHIHKRGGFEIRGILSTSRKVHNHFGEDCKTSAKTLEIESSIVTERVLGMFWDVKSDCFTYLLKYTKIDDDVLSGKRRPTKRELLKTLMSIFDPLGLLAFFLVYLKIVMQETWINNLQWDEQLTDELYEKWSYWLKFLPQVENIKIPRLYSHLLSPRDPDLIELHTFVDAGENAYSAVSFLRIISTEEIDVALVGAKTKVAPKQKLSIPKLELLSGVLGSRLSLSIVKGLTVKIDKRYFHSDSQTVLGWIKCNHRKLRQFVAFRIGEILDLTKESEWRYVPGKENVADDATKWIKEPRFHQNSRWFRGPEFLRKNESYWPKQIENLDETDEMRQEFRLHLAHMPIDPPTLIEPERFSKWERMLRAQAYVSRSIKIWSAKVREEPIPKGPITHEELARAEKLLYRLAQFDNFAEEIAILQFDDQSKAKIEITSPLYTCSPYLDEAGVLRMRGRTDAADVSFDTKRPIILPTKHRITWLIADSYHRRLFHCYRETIVNEMMQKFHVPGIRSIVKKVIKDCQKCKNRRAKPLAPEMANLPVARLSHHKVAFSFVGIDYFGPIYITHRRQREKRWGVIFTCLTMRAIHIEVASTLDTQSCIWCIRNFQAIRGTPLEYYSDNGTNLKAADKELKAELKKVDQNALCTRFSIHSKWNFNPPSSPHMGGSWEKMISSVKKCLKQAIPERNPPYEMLRNLLMEVVNIINSRPLTFVSIDSAEQEAITPNHLLVGSSSGSKNDDWDASSSVLYPSGDFKEDAKIIGRNWRISQQRANYFWKRWVQSYLPTLTRRTKWFDKVKPIEIGDVVIIVDEKNSRNVWPKGIVIDTPNIDKNGQVRSATVKVVAAVGPPKINKDGKMDVKTTESVYVRPVHKLAILDVHNEKEDVEVKEI